MLASRRIGVSVCVAAAVVATVPATASAVPVITVSGSTSVAPLTALLAKGYIKNRKLKGKLKFKLAQGGSDVGVADVAAGRVSIGTSSRDPKPSDQGVVFHKIAKDALCVVTHPSNGIANLTQDQIQAIFAGTVRNWEDVPGAKVTGPINITVRTPASGTQDAFQKIFMGSKSVSSTASAKASNGLIQQTVASDNNAIGYVSADFLKGTVAAAYQGVACNVQNAKSGQYGGARLFYMVTRGPAKGATFRFINWVQSNAAAQRIIGTHWVPLR